MDLEQNLYTDALIILLWNTELSRTAELVATMSYK